MNPSQRAARKALALAGVPQDLHASALASMALAQERHAGLLWVKAKARLWYAKKLAKAAPWAAEHVEEFAPDFAQYGLAPNLGKGLNGDNVPWVEVFAMPGGGEREMHTFGQPRNSQLPEPLRTQAEAAMAQRWADMIAAGGKWQRAEPTQTPQELGTDPAELEHQTACARNYWGHRFFAGAKGLHPRHWRSRLAWLRSNGGERQAWERGANLPAGERSAWIGANGRRTARAEYATGAILGGGGELDVWEIVYSVRLLGRWHITWRLGFELANSSGAAPMNGYPNRACVTWGCRPERIEP